MGQACRDAFIAEMPFTSQASSLQFLTILNGILYMVLGSIIGYPIASASARALRGLWQNDLVALRGACPNCGDEVFAFVRFKSNHSSHRTECHVCDSMLEFRTKVESISIPGQRWVYGRVYLIQKQEKRQR
ncbi:unnamed protein product [Cuscuta campestris]|uniref:Uncharacterized protein n=1 Tax=Cuscuta campestris TaxID=132261 RepID=A0A484MRF7_9ASTE|nr:unnamed protein product [Cuscuta campestris]